MAHQRDPYQRDPYQQGAPGVPARTGAPDYGTPPSSVAPRDGATQDAVEWSAYRAQLGISTSGVVGGLPQDPSVLSYLVLAGMVLDVPERQHLLELPDTATRLREERALLRTEQVLVRELRSLPSQDLASETPNPN